MCRSDGFSSTIVLLFQFSSQPGVYFQKDTKSNFSSTCMLCVLYNMLCFGVRLWRGFAQNEQGTYSLQSIAAKQWEDVDI